MELLAINNSYLVIVKWLIVAIKLSNIHVWVVQMIKQYVVVKAFAEGCLLNLGQLLCMYIIII